MGLLSLGLLFLAVVTIVNCEEKVEFEKIIAQRTQPHDEKSEIDDMNAPLLVSATSSRLYDYSNYDSLTARYAPQDPPSHTEYNKYIITEQRLKEIRAEFMYWFFDKGGPNDEGDLQRDIHSSNPQLHKNFNFQLPFYGSRFNYTRLSLNGYLEFSDPPDHYTYPLSFPIKDWPKINDPAFIGIFFSKCRIGNIRPDDLDLRAAGVYFRLERDLMTRTDMFGVEMRERLMWDIREGVIGSETFIPKHAIIATWKNVSFAGGIDNSLYKTNSFQLVIATDEVYSYAIFNYRELQWTTHTEAGGDTSGGEGGVPAYVGFNAGNGTGAVEYLPYSQASVLRDLTGRGWANGFPGRHIFRLDEKIMLGTCNKDVAGTNLPLVFAPESGNMLGGTVVNITGPCFEPNMRIRCRFDTEEVIGTYINANRAICVQPYLNVEGYIRFEVSVRDGAFNWKGKYFVETPATAMERIHFMTNDVHMKNPNEIAITWEKYNLTTNTAASLTISLFGYKETTIRPQLMYIDILETGIPNSGSYVIQPATYKNRYNLPELLELEYGFIQINLTSPETNSGLSISPVLWSRPIPLGWYFNGQWERKYGPKWEMALCDRWLMYDRYLKNFASEIPVCPCTQKHALNDKGRYLPDPGCDRDINPDCFYHKGALHCVRSGAPSLEGSEQQCCYDKDGYLMMSYDQQWGSRPRRSHNLGFLPWNEANKVPTLSQWFHDVIPFYSCCMWQDEQAVGCETLRFERRPSQDCVAYQSPFVATVFGDPHIITFDNVEYTFNGKGEFVLVQANAGKELLNIQGRFEQVPYNIYGEVRATQLTSIVAQDNSSVVIEVKIRQAHAQWRYRLDVLADKKRIYFDRPALKSQHFRGVTVYTPTNTIDQSQVIIMFPSGAGVEVTEEKGYMSARVYLPWTFLNKTRGLFGNWSFDVTDEFVLPDGTLAGVSTNINSFESVHTNFAIKWLLEEGDEAYKGISLFAHENNRMGSYYTNKTFVPEYRSNPADFVPANRTYDIVRANELCGQSYQCKYDYAMTLNEGMARQTLKFREQYLQVQQENKEIVKSCGVLETPRFGRKSNFRFVPGTKVTFECNQDFTLVGDQRRTCLAEGRWDVPEYGYTECLRRVEYEQRQGWTATGIILAVMIPLVIIILCIFLHVKKNKKKKYIPVSIKPLLARAKSGTESLFTPNKKNKRVYDKVYRTNEPVPGRPPIDFNGREPDLSSVEDQNIAALVEKAHDRVKTSSDTETGDDASISSHDSLPNVERGVATSGSSEDSDDYSREKPPSKRSKKSSKSSKSSNPSNKDSDDYASVKPPSKRSKKSSKSSKSSTPSSKTSSFSSQASTIPPTSDKQPSSKGSSVKSNSSETPLSKSSKSSDSDTSKQFQSANTSPLPAFVKADRFKGVVSSAESDLSDPSPPPPKIVSGVSKSRPPRPPPPKYPQYVPSPSSLNSSGRSTSSQGGSSSASHDSGMQEYSSRAAAVTWGIVLLVVVPIAIALIFIAFRYVKKNDIDVGQTIRKKSLTKKTSTERRQRETAVMQD